MRPPADWKVDKHPWIRTLSVPAALRDRVFCSTAQLADPQQSLADFRPLLAADELARADRFLVEAARRRFVLGRVALRLILAAWLEADPAEIRFAYTPQGKPFLVRPEHPERLSFNLAHSADLAVIALSLHYRVGIDLEQIRQRPDLNEVAERFFAPAERDLLQRTEATLRLREFYRLWTRKEAVLKGTGQGITSGLHEPDVSGATGAREHASALVVTLAGIRWDVYDLEPAPGYQAALAVQIH